MCIDIAIDKLILILGTIFIDNYVDKPIVAIDIGTEQIDGNIYVHRY